LSGEKEHPWKLTRYLYLVDMETGEVSTFWSNTTGEKIAFDELYNQVKFVRTAQPNAIAIITLESTMFQTSFGSKKARPHFRILGYKMRGQVGSQNMLTDETKAPLVEVEKPSLAGEMNDELPDFEAPKKQKTKKQ
jgi:hypothetical protein